MAVVDLEAVNFYDPVYISSSRVDAEVGLGSSSSAGDRAGNGDGRSAEARNLGIPSIGDEDLHGQIDEFMPTSWHLQDDAECNNVVNVCTANRWPYT